MSLKSFEPYSKRNRPNFDQSFFKAWDDQSGTWLYWQRDFEKVLPGILSFHPMKVSDVAFDSSWIPCSQKEYDRGLLEFDTKARISSSGVPKFETPEEAEAWLNAQ